MLTAKAMRKLANSKVTFEAFSEAIDRVILDAANRGNTSTYYPVPRNNYIFKRLKKRLTDDGFKYSIGAVTGMKITW